MLYIEKDGSIKLTRGDTARITVNIYNDIEKEDYEMIFSDTLRLTVKKSYKDREYALQKVSIGSNRFYIRPEDTNTLPFGKYVYDVELTTDNGDVYTVIEPSPFELLKEVTY